MASPTTSATASASSELQALLREARANPLDDAPRLIVADWLEEHGDTDRAAFVRLQCTAAGLPPWDWRRVQAEAQAQLLLPVRFMQLLSISWLPSLPPAPGATV